LCKSGKQPAGGRKDEFNLEQVTIENSDAFNAFGWFSITDGIWRA